LLSIWNRSNRIDEVLFSIRIGVGVLIVLIDKR